MLSIVSYSPLPQRQYANILFRSYTYVASNFRPGNFPSQCQSSYSESDVLIFQTKDHGDGYKWKETATTITSGESSVVYGFHVNGLNVVSKTSSAQLTTKTVAVVEKVQVEGEIVVEVLWKHGARGDRLARCN
jgi:hypothetical protein